MTAHKPTIPPGVSPKEVEYIWRLLTKNALLLDGLKAQVAPLDLTVVCAYLVAAMEVQESVFTTAFDRARAVFGYQYPMMLTEVEENDPTMTRDESKLLILTPHAYDEPTVVN
jgi:hypothetical protein